MQEIEFLFSFVIEHLCGSKIQQALFNHLCKHSDILFIFNTVAIYLQEEKAQGIFTRRVSLNLIEIYAKA